MKPVDLQISVRKSQDATRGFSVKDRAVGAAMANMNTDFEKDLNQRQRKVTQNERIFNARIEDRKRKRDQDEADSQAGHRQKNNDDKPSDPAKGLIVDTTAGFLA